MNDSSSTSALRALARDLVSFEDSGRLSIRSSNELTQALHFSELPQSGLLDDINAADIVIAKGDLNYRRFVEDRRWVLDTPVEVACSRVPFRALCLRVLKSEPLVGIEDPLAVSLRARSDNWRWSGNFAVAQILGSKPEPDQSDVRIR